jgi:hypothetical protein
MVQYHPMAIKGRWRKGFVLDGDHKDAEQVMISVFIGGSRNITRFNDEIKRRIDRIIENGYPVLVGDANGADKAVQEYLKGRGYHFVEVFCIEGACLNNIGNWPLRSIPAPNGRRDFSYYEAKDIVMADEASVGFMIWDGRSIGTLMNVFRLVDQQKKVVLYSAPNHEFSNLKSKADWEHLLASAGSDVRRRISTRTGTSEQSDSRTSPVSLF